MTLATIDWLRAGADILGAFACAHVGQMWGYRQGRKVPPSDTARQAAIDGALRELARGDQIAATVWLIPFVRHGATPDRDSERLPL